MFKIWFFAQASKSYLLSLKNLLTRPIEALTLYARLDKGFRKIRLSTRVYNVHHSSRVDLYKKRLSAKKENFDVGGGGGLLFDDDEAKPTATTNAEEKERKNLSMRTDDIRPVNLRA